MTLSTPDLGGMGNGLGLPIANPLYGPANAAFMGSQAFKQNMENAQASTAQTQAQTNRINTMLPYETANMEATTENTKAIAAKAQLENAATSTLSPELRGSYLAAVGQQNISKAAEDSEQTFQRQYIMAAQGGVLDKKPPQEQDDWVRQQAKAAGMSDAQAEQHVGIYGSRGIASAPQLTGGTAANGPAAGSVTSHQAHADALQLANPELMKTQMQEAGATGRTEKQIAAEKEINQSKIDAELKVKGMDLENNPQTAFQYLQGRYIEETNKGNSALANQYLERAKSAYSNQMQMLWAQSAARNAYNPNLQGLAQGILTNNANVGPGQMPGGGGGGGGGVQVGQEIAPGVRVVGVPGGGGGGGGFAPNMPNIAPVQTQPTQPAQSTPTPVSQSMAGRRGFPGGQGPVDARTAVLSQERDEIMARPDTDPNKQEDLNDINYQIQKVSGIPGATQAPQQPQPQAGPANAAVQKPNPQQAKVQQIQQIAQSLPPDVQQSIKQFEQETPGHGVGRARLHLEMMIDREKEGWTREQLGQAVVLRQRLLQLEQLTR